MTPEKVLHSFKRKFKTKIKNAVVEEIPHKSKHTNHLKRVWFDVDRKAFKDAVGHLCREYTDPHFSVCSGYDLGKELVVNYHFTVNYDHRAGEIIITMK